MCDYAEFQPSGTQTSDDASRTVKLNQVAHLSHSGRSDGGSAVPGSPKIAEAEP